MLPKTITHDYYGDIYALRQLEDGREIVVLPWSFAGAQLSIGRRTGWWDDTWNYAHNVPAAIEQAQTWDGNGEPDHWTRHPATGRRRPDGDPDQEYIQR